MSDPTTTGKLNVSKLIIAIIIILLIIAIYYVFILKVEEGENKAFKLLKRVLILIIFVGLFHVYSVLEDDNMKQFFLVIIAVLVNVFSVINSTRNTEIKKMRIINLTLTSAAVTILVAGILWYTTHNSLFGFIIDDNKVVDEIKDVTGDTFNSNMIDNILFDKESGCPIASGEKCIDMPDKCNGFNGNYDKDICLLELDDSEKQACNTRNNDKDECKDKQTIKDECESKKTNYRNQMNLLHDRDINKFNKCLENEVRSNLKVGI